MYFEEAKQKQIALESEFNRASARMQSFPKHDNGLTPDHVKSSVEFRVAKQSFEIARANLQRFNRWFTKQFKRELREDRRKRGR